MVPGFAVASRAAQARPSAANSATNLVTATTTTGSITSDADAYVTPVTPSTNYGAVRTLAADGSPVAEAYLAFDTTRFKGLAVDHALLWIATQDGARPRPSAGRDTAARAANTVA